MTLTEKVAYVTQEEFNRLDEYSTSVPTGKTIGKIWKRREPWRAQGKEARWFLGEYVTLPNETKFIGIRWRDLVVGEPVEFLDYQI